MLSVRIDKELNTVSIWNLESNDCLTIDDIDEKLYRSLKYKEHYLILKNSLSTLHIKAEDSKGHQVTFELPYSGCIVKITEK